MIFGELHRNRVRRICLKAERHVLLALTCFKQIGNQLFYREAVFEFLKWCITTEQQFSCWEKETPAQKRQRKTEIKRKSKKYVVFFLKIRRRNAAFGRQTAEVPFSQLPSVASGLLRQGWWEGGFTCKPHNTSRLQQNHEVDYWSNWPQEKSKPS